MAAFANPLFCYGFLAFYGMFAPSDGQNIMFLRGRLEYDAQGSVCEGSGARRPDSTSKSMAGGWPGAAGSDQELKNTVAIRPV